MTKRQRERCDRCQKWVYECSLGTLEGFVDSELSYAGEFAICSRCFEREKDWTAWVHRKRESALMEAQHELFQSYILSQQSVSIPPARSDSNGETLHANNSREILYTNSSVKARSRV